MTDGGMADVMKTLNDISEAALADVLTSEQRTTLEAGLAGVSAELGDEERVALVQARTQEVMSGLSEAQREALVARNVQWRDMVRIYN